MNLLENIIALSQIKITDDMNEHKVISATRRNDYYKRVLTAIHNGKSTPFNWSAGFAPMLWLIYRRMNAASIFIVPLIFFSIVAITLIALAIVAGLKLIFPISEGLFALLFFPFVIFLRIFLPGKFLNNHYYFFLRNKVMLDYDPQFSNLSTQLLLPYVFF